MRPQLSITPILVTLQLVYQLAVAGPLHVAANHSYAKRRAEIDTCNEKYTTMLTVALADVRDIATVGLRDIEWLEVHYYDLSPASGLNKRRILWVLKALFGDLIAARGHGLGWPLDELKGMVRS